ncbi:MAG: metal-sulfur cluster assembly factor [Acidimicrobiales bacterium]
MNTVNTVNNSNFDSPPRRARVTTESGDDPLGWVLDALSDVIDPELGLDIVALGLVYDVREEAGTLVVEMTLTTPGCPASESLSAQAAHALAEAGSRSLASVEIRLVWDPPWSPMLIDEHAAAALGFRLR